MIDSLLPVFLCCLVLFVILMFGMAIGVIFGNKPIAGSCGGMKALNMGTACDICGDDPNKCDTLSDDLKKNATLKQGNLYYPADK
ncbi:MAG: (Na+)-NQR maturation NqrM [Pseudomonadota bacterium]